MSEALDEFAKEHNLDPIALRGLYDFLMRHAQRLKDEGKGWLFETESGCREFVKQGIVAWDKMGREYYERLLNPKTAEDYAEIERLKSEIYDACRKNSQ